MSDFTNGQPEINFYDFKKKWLVKKTTILIIKIYSNDRDTIIAKYPSPYNGTETSYRSKVQYVQYAPCRV